MDNIIAIIDSCYHMLSDNSLTFGNFSFSLLSILITFGGLALAGWFFGHLFNSN